MKKNISLILLSLIFSLACFSQELVEPQQLKFAKENIDKIKNGRTALDALLYNADKLLKKRLVPVTEKNIIAISNDKHDYISMGPYWWPNPSTPDGLPYIKKDGQRNPETAKLDRNKLGNLSKSVNALTYAYYFSGDEKYAEKAVDNLRVWFLNKDTKMNPNLNFGQIIPGHNGGKGRGIGLIDTYCLIELTYNINILAESKAMTTDDLKGLKQWYADFLDWMLTSPLGIDESNEANNHSVSYDVQATAYALFTGKTDVAKKIIAEFPERRMFAQIKPDGSQPLELARTIAMHYTIFNIKHFTDMSLLAKSINIDLYSKTSADGRSIPKAVDFIKVYLGVAKSDFPYEQIKEWDENQEKLCWTLRRATFFQPNKEYDELFNKYCTSEASNINWLFYAK